MVSPRCICWPAITAKLARCPYRVLMPRPCYHNSAAVAAKEVSEGDHSIRRSDHRSSEGCRNIHPAVKRAFPVERVDALDERARNGAFHGPEVGGCVGPDPVGHGHVAV